MNSSSMVNFKKTVNRVLSVFIPKDLSPKVHSWIDPCLSLITNSLLLFIPKKVYFESAYIEREQVK